MDLELDKGKEGMLVLRLGCVMFFSLGSFVGVLEVVVGNVCMGDDGNVLLLIGCGMNVVVCGCWVWWGRMLGLD